MKEKKINAKAKHMKKNPDDGNTDSNILSPKPKITLACSQFCVLLYDYIILVRSCDDIGATTRFYIPRDVVQHDIFCILSAKTRTPLTRSLSLLPLDFQMDEQTPATRKRSAGPDSHPQSSSKKKRQGVAVNLGERFAKAIGEVLVSSVNEDHRQKCLDTLGVNNGSEATERIEILVKTLKASKERRAIKTDSKENQ
jgi:hypothetical protein